MSHQLENSNIDQYSLSASGGEMLLLQRIFSENRQKTVEQRNAVDVVYFIFNKINNEILISKL